MVIQYSLDLLDWLKLPGYFSTIMDYDHARLVYAATLGYSPTLLKLVTSNKVKYYSSFFEAEVKIKNPA